MCKRLDWRTIIVALAVSVIAGEVNATTFTMTTESPGMIGFLDADSMTHGIQVRRAMTYAVFSKDAAVPPGVTPFGNGTTYAASASDVLFECETKHYTIASIFFYDARGLIVASFPHPVLADEPVPPQTGVEEQFAHVCQDKPLSNKISNFPDDETPLQMLIRVARATMADPRYVSP